MSIRPNYRLAVPDDGDLRGTCYASFSDQDVNEQ